MCVMRMSCDYIEYFWRFWRVEVLRSTLHTCVSYEEEDTCVSYTFGA
jgi:hypothetical protein